MVRRVLWLSRGNQHHSQNRKEYKKQKLKHKMEDDAEDSIQDCKRLRQVKRQRNWAHN